MLRFLFWDAGDQLGFSGDVGQRTTGPFGRPDRPPRVPWPALVILALSTNTWYYATNQYINQRCLAARDEWHAKMGVLFAGGLQLLIPLATCFPAMAYRVLDPNLTDHNAAYPTVVAAFVPMGLRRLVAAAIVGAIMSTISGLVNSTSTIVTLDIVQRGIGRQWSEERLVRVGRWSGAAALLIGALFAPVVMRWESLFRYAQDIWAPMAAPVVVVFLAGALWEKASARAAHLCLWLALLTVPLTLTKSFLADLDIHFLPENLENPLVFAGAVSLASWALMFVFSSVRSWAWAAALVGTLWAGIGLMAVWSPSAAALILAGVMGAVIGAAVLQRKHPAVGLWDVSMLRTWPLRPWFASIWFWWSISAGVFAFLYILFW